MSTFKSSVCVTAIVLYALSPATSIRAQEQQGNTGENGKRYFLGIPGLELLERSASTSHECVVYRYCEDGGYPYAEPLAGYVDGGSCAECISSVECDPNCEGGVCCEDTNPPAGSFCADNYLAAECYEYESLNLRLRYSPPGDQEPFEIQTRAPKLFGIDSPTQNPPAGSGLLFHEFSAIGKASGILITGFHSKREAAFEMFRKLAVAHKGIVAGTLRTRVVPAVLHRVYVRVQSESKDGKMLIDQEVTAQSSIEAVAVSQAHYAATQLATLLGELGHTKVKVMPSFRLVTKANTLLNLCRGSKLCRHECTVKGSKVEGNQKICTIRTARHADTTTKACAAAGAAAIVIADSYGGIKPGSCVNLIENSGIIEEGMSPACSDCSSQDSASSESDSDESISK